MDNRDIGQQAELRACAFLEKKGLKLLARNYRCTLGEIDLIMQDEDDIVFVEVRKRSHSNFGSAAESVTETKQRKLIKTALHYLQKYNCLDKMQCRFDVIGFSQTHLEWIKDAFSVENF